MARHQIRAAKPKPEKPKAELRAAPSWYDRTHPVGSAERFLDQAAKEAMVAAAAGGLAEPRQLAAGAVKAVAKKASEYPDPLLQRAAELPAAELAKRAARAEAYNQAMQAQNGVVQAVTASLSPVADLARSQASAALATRQDAKGGDADSETAVPDDTTTDTGGDKAAETFDTPIPEELQAKYDAWYTQLPKNLQYTGDYDLQGAWLEKLGQPDKYEATQTGHLDDYGKKPNHITFSTGSKWHDPKVPERTGGEWRQAEDGSWDFYPGTGNKASDDELKAYFDKYEKGNRVHKREVRQDAKGGDSAGEDNLADPPPEVRLTVPEAGGPRIVINPTTFKNSKDALCVAFNEGFRLWMEANDFEPQSEPTDAQRKFFSDTAYADDEVQLRRTILARIATFDTSVKDPTDDQLSETASFLNAVLESDWCKSEWERNSVQKLARAVEASVGAEPVEPKAEPVEPRAEEPLQARAALGGGETADEEDEPKNGAVRYVEKDGSYYRQTYVEGETDASSGWRGEAIGKDEWDSAQRNIEKGVSAQRFAEAWDAGTEDWNKQQKEIRGLMDENTEAHNEVNRMVANGTITPERGQWAHSADSSDDSEGGWTWRNPESGRLLTLDADDIRGIFGKPEDRGAVGFQHGGDRGLLNQTRTLDLDLNEDELAKKATSSALAGLANMEPDKAEPQVAKAPETSPITETPPAPETAVAESRAESVAETPATAPAAKETVQQGGSTKQPQNGGPALATSPVKQDEGASGGTSGHTVAERRARHPLRMNGPSIAPVRPIGDIGATSFTDTKRMNGPSIEPERAIGDIGATSFTDDGMNGPSIEPARPIGAVDTADGSGGSTLRRKKRRRSRT